MLVKELQSLCLDVKVLDKNGEEIELKDDEEDDFIPGFRDKDDYRADDSELEAAGYAIEDPDEGDLGDYDYAGDDEDDMDFEEE